SPSCTWNSVETRWLADRSKEKAISELSAVGVRFGRTLVHVLAEALGHARGQQVRHEVHGARHDRVSALGRFLFHAFEGGSELFCLLRTEGLTGSGVDARFFLGDMMAQVLTQLLG